MGSVVEIEKVLFRLWLVRFLAAAFFLARGSAYFLFDRYRAICDFCWVVRVSRVALLRPLAHRVVLAFAFGSGTAHSRLVAAFLRSSASAQYGRLRPPADGGSDGVFRDVIVLKAPRQHEKGVLLLKYTAKFDRFVALFDLERVMSDYSIVLEPCWAGYCDTSILMFRSLNNEVVVQCPDRSDFDFISGLGGNFIPVPLGASDWVDPDLFSSDDSGADKDYDLIMVANWGRHKNHRRLFQALPDVRRRPLSVLLIGYDWAGRTDKDIIAEMSRYDLAGVRVDVKKNLPPQQVAAHLRKSRAFVLLSEKEGSNKAVVEALFCNVPIIVYEGFIGGAVSKVNPDTGALTSFARLAETIDRVLENAATFTPRTWAMQHTGSRNSTIVMNECLRRNALSNGRPWTADIVEKVNRPNLAYRDPAAVPETMQFRSVAATYRR